MWCERNNVVVNFGKTLYIPFSYGGRKTELGSVEMDIKGNNIVINSTKQVTFLE